METFAIEKTKELRILPAPGSSETDFDFLIGKWKVQNRKLKERLNECQEWIEFPSELHIRKVLAGLGNVETYTAEFDGKPFGGLAIRTFNPQTRLWSIHWIDSNNPWMDEHPVTGSFENGIGEFYAKDVFNGKDITVIYKWDATDPEHPVWTQAFSEDEGESWEWNWEMKVIRIE